MHRQSKSSHQFQNKSPYFCFRAKVGAAYFSFDFLFQRIKLRRVEELTEGNLQPVTDHLDGEQLWILALAVEDILYILPTVVDGTFGFQCSTFSIVSWHFSS